MRAFLCEINHEGLRWLLRVEEASFGEWPRTGQAWHAPVLVWALLAEPDAAALRADVKACGLLLNRALKLIALGDARQPS